jgi:uncharacterized protein (TIGR00266 family)
MSSDAPQTSRKVSKKASQTQLKEQDKIRTRSLRPYSFSNISIPDYKIYHKPANASIVMNIKEGQSVFANAGMMVWMDDNLKVSTQSRGIWDGLKRFLLTSDSFFLTSYSGTSAKGDKICFAPMMLGDITEIKIKPGEKKLVSSGSVVCCTENIILSTRTRLRGALVGSGAVLSELSVPEESEKYGLAWISSYGGIEILEIKDGQTMKLDNGHFLMCDGNVQYGIGRVGGIKSALFSGEGLVMVFKGPCTIYTQNRNQNSLLEWVIRHIPKK